MGSSTVTFMTTEYLLNEQVERVLQLLTPVNRRVCRTALHTGLRIGDVLSFKTDKIAAHFWIKEQKTGKKRIVGLTKELLEDLRAHAGKEWVFPGRSGKKPQTRQAVWADVKREAKAIRLEANAAPHSLRKCYAVDLMHRYGDIERVRRCLRHDRSTTTMIYAMADHLLRQESKKPRRRP